MGVGGQQLPGQVMKGVHVRVTSLAKWLRHQSTNRKVVESTPGLATLVLLLFP